MAEFQTDKTDITKTRLVSAGESVADFTLADGEILVAIERFAFTANNVTYGAIGEQIGYWQFFPPSESAESAEGDWGLVPVWGFANVVASKNSDIELGERFYGYFPMANFLQMVPTRVTDDRLVDGAAHRAELPPVYNSYDRLGTAAGNAMADGMRALLNPLYGTSYCLCDALQEQDYHGAEQVVILSASSKTAIGLAYGLSQLDGQRPRIVGLTSPSNVAFTRSVGSYDEVIAYDDLAALKHAPSVLVDMSGNAPVLGALHGALGENMRWCHNVGLTHWDTSEAQKDPAVAQIIRDRSAMFFAPGHIQRRAREWGALDFNAKVADFLAGGMAHAQNWMDVKETQGLENFGSIYDAVVAGDMRAQEGLIILP
jgi:hypothetical protein